MSWPWIVLLVLGVCVVVAAEWSRVSGVVGTDARRRRDREKRKAKLRVVPTDDDDFVESVQRDLDALPTIEEPRTKRS
ncbi:MAG: hypothetical protein H0W16_10355 [Actinobacteria bacterium]|nr:hypothetical protein [Actinomycetota bacterium]